MDSKQNESLSVDHSERQRQKPLYERPQLIKLEDEIKWSRGGGPPSEAGCA